KRKSADRRDRAEPARAAHGEEIKAAGKYDYAEDEEPARRRQPRARPAPRGRRDGEEPQRVVHVIAHADLEDVEHIRRELVFEAVRGERAERDAEKSGQRAEREEKTVHVLIVSEFFQGKTRVL